MHWGTRHLNRILKNTPINVEKILFSLFLLGQGRHMEYERLMGSFYLKIPLSMKYPPIP